MNISKLFNRYYPVLPLILCLYFVIASLHKYLVFVDPKFRVFDPNYTFWNGVMYSELYGKVVIIGLATIILLIILNVLILRKNSGSLGLLFLNIMVSMYFLNLSATAFGASVMVPLIQIEEISGNKCFDCASLNSNK